MVIFLQVKESALPMTWTISGKFDQMIEVEMILQKGKFTGFAPRSYKNFSAHQGRPL